MKPLSIPGIHPDNIISNATVFKIDGNIVVIYQSPYSPANNWHVTVYPGDGCSASCVANGTKEIIRHAKRIASEMCGKSENRRRLKAALNTIVASL